MAFNEFVSPKAKAATKVREASMALASSVILGKLDSLINGVDFEERRQDDIVNHAEEFLDAIRQYNLGELEKLQELKDELSADEIKAIVADLTNNSNDKIIDITLGERIESLEKFHDQSMTTFGGILQNGPKIGKSDEDLDSLTNQVKALNIRIATMLARTKNLRDEASQYFSDLATKIDQYTAD